MTAKRLVAISLGVARGELTSSKLLAHSYGEAGTRVIFQDLRRFLI